MQLNMRSTSLASASHCCYHFEHKPSTTIEKTSTRTWLSPLLQFLFYAAVLTSFAPGSGSNSIVVDAVSNPEDFVNLLAGSFTDGDRFSTGNTLPLVGRPWGFNHWSPQTRAANRNTGSWWFKGSDHVMTWFRCTHQPSPWIGDWGWFVFTPQIGGPDRNPTHYYEPRGAVMKPHLFDATLAPHDIRLEFTPTDHAGIARVTFPLKTASGKKSICFTDFKADGDAVDKTNDGLRKLITGKSLSVHSERMIVAKFAMHVRAESAEAESVQTHGDMKCFLFRSDATVVHVRMATSLISAEQALTNLDREIKLSKGFDDIALESKTVWNKMLKRVDVVDPGDISEAASRHLGVFYTGLYRALTFPRNLAEVNALGKTVHYSPYDPHGATTWEGPLMTDNGFWDTFRTVYPLLSLVYPDHLGRVIQGWLNAYREGGWLPSWASPGYRNCMVGTFADVVVADAIVKGVKGFDLSMAVAAITKDAYEAAPKFAGGAVGKEDLSDYISKGYLSKGGDTVSRTLDYGFADFASSQAFSVLAKLKDRDTSSTTGAMALGSAAAGLALSSDELRHKAKELSDRSTRAASSLFDKSQGFMVPKSGTGQFSRSFSPNEWGNGYTEGNAWHHSFPPYAIDVNDYNKGLPGQFGGASKFLKKLHDLLDAPANFGVGSYHQEIHEMTEMRAVAMGQYGHNNQPSHHILYLFAMLGEARTTQDTVRHVMDHAYGLDFFAGDEDNGEMGAWFVLSALGLFPTTPGTPNYVLGTPLFRHVRIARASPDHVAEDGQYTHPDLKYDPLYDSPPTYGPQGKGGSSSSSAVGSAWNAILGRTNGDNGDNGDTGTAGTAATASSGPFAAGEPCLDIVALGTGPETWRVNRVILNNKEVVGPHVLDSVLQGDSLLRFVMEGEAPPLLSDSPASKFDRENLLASEGPHNNHSPLPEKRTEKTEKLEKEVLELKKEVETEKNSITELEHELSHTKQLLALATSGLPSAGGSLLAKETTRHGLGGGVYGGADAESLVLTPELVHGMDRNTEDEVFVVFVVFMIALCCMKGCCSSKRSGGGYKRGGGGALGSLDDFQSPFKVLESQSSSDPTARLLLSDESSSSSSGSNSSSSTNSIAYEYNGNNNVGGSGSSSSGWFKGAMYSCGGIYRSILLKIKQYTGLDLNGKGPAASSSFASISSSATKDRAHRV